MIKFNIRTTHDASELVADIAMQYSRAGVSIEDAADVGDLWNSTLVWDYIEESVLNREKDYVKVSGFYDGEFFEIEEELKNSLKNLMKYCDFCGDLALSYEQISDTNWTEDWKKFYEIINVGNLSVVPIWKKDEAENELKVLINPGSAFGTGEHESTRLCLKLLQKIQVLGKKVMDTGCGSGILGLAALALGAKSCDFRDIDESALNNLRENIGLNGAIGKVECASLLEGITTKYDIILANITADILSRMTNAADCINKDGYLIMSGIIDKYAESLIKQFTDYGFTLLEQETDGIWTGLLLKK